MGFINETVITPDSVPTVVDVHVGSRTATIDLQKEQRWANDQYLVKMTQENPGELLISFSPERFGVGDPTVVAINTQTGVVRTAGHLVAQVDGDANGYVRILIHNPNDAHRFLGALYGDITRGRL